MHIGFTHRATHQNIPGNIGWPKMIILVTFQWRLINLECYRTRQLKMFTLLISSVRWGGMLIIQPCGHDTPPETGCVPFLQMQVSPYRLCRVWRQRMLSVMQYILVNSCERNREVLNSQFMVWFMYQLWSWKSLGVKLWIKCKLQGGAD